jgi:hypothetical protein
MNSYSRTRAFCKGISSGGRARAAASRVQVASVGDSAWVTAAAIWRVRARGRRAAARQRRGSTAARRRVPSRARASASNSSCQAETPTSESSCRLPSARPPSVRPSGRASAACGIRRHEYGECVCVGGGSAVNAQDEAVLSLTALPGSRFAARSFEQSRRGATPRSGNRDDAGSCTARAASFPGDTGACRLVRKAVLAPCRDRQGSRAATLYGSNFAEH